MVRYGGSIVGLLIKLSTRNQWNQASTLQAVLVDVTLVDIINYNQVTTKINV